MENNIQFDEPGGAYNRAPAQMGQSFPTRLVLKTGLAKNEQQAQYVLVGIAILAVAGAFFMYPSNKGGAVPAPVFNTSGGRAQPRVNTRTQTPTVNTANDDLLNF